MSAPSPVVPPVKEKRKYVRKDDGTAKRARKEPPTVPPGLKAHAPVPAIVISQSPVPGVAQAPNAGAISSIDAAAATAQRMADLALAAKMEYKKELLAQQYRVEVETSMKEYKARMTDCDMPQTKQVVECNVYLSRSEQELIRRTEPHIRLRSTAHPMPHPHPVLHLERERAEQSAYQYVKSVCEKKGVPLKIVDIGGNAARHSAKNRRDVHCCCPVMSSADAMRGLHHGMVAGDVASYRRCEHLAQECDCVEPDVYLSVDSLYYLTPELLAKLVMRTRNNLLVATCHEFDDAYGSFANGEATYQLIDNETVSMNVRGNLQSYVHSNLGWLRRGGYHFTVQRPCVGTDGVVVEQAVDYTLCWSKVGAQFPYHSTYGFTVVPRKLELNEHRETTLVSSIQNNKYYGEVTMRGIFNEKGDVNAVGEIFDIPDLKVHSWGGYVMVYKSQSNVTMLAPKGLIDSAASFVAGTKRTAERFAALVNHLKYKAKSLNLPESMLSTSVFAAACLGFVQNAGFETAVMHGVVKHMLPTLDIHADALALKFRRVWTWKKVAAAMVTAATIAGGSYAAAHAIVPVVAPVVAAAGVAAFGVAGAVATGLAWYNNLPHDPFHNYRIDRSSVPATTRIVPLRAGTRLPSTCPPKSVEQLMDRNLNPIDVTADLKVQDPTEKKERLDPLCPYGIVSSMAIPVVPENSCHSALSADVERSLKPQMFHKPTKYDTLHFDKFQKWVMTHLDELLPGMRKAVKGSAFATWNNRPTFTKSQRFKQQKVFDHLRANGLDDIGRMTQKEMHTKIEVLMKSGASDDCRESVEKLAPRAIQGAKTEFNVIVAPWIYGFSKALANCWHIGNADGPVYTSGADNAQIGKFVQQALRRNPGHAAILEGDFSRFDTTVHRRLQALEIAIYEWCGAPAHVIALLRANIKTVGGDKWKNKYTVDGTRHSGDPQTSCGNSLLQALCLLFSMACHDQARSKSNVLRSPRDLIETYDINLLCLGDDNHCVADEAFLTSFPSVDYLAKLGLDLEPKLHVGPDAVWHSTFCSSRFYPCVNSKDEDCIVLGPPIGRVSAKAGWYVNPPENIAPERLVAGDVAGRFQDSKFIPFLRVYWQRCQQLTKTVAPEDRRMLKDARRQHYFVSHTRESFEASAATFSMVEKVYGLTQKQEDEYVSHMAKIGSLGVVSDFAPLRHAMIVDGVLPDDHKENKEDAILVSPPLPERTVDHVIKDYGEGCSSTGICAYCMSVGCPGNVRTVLPSGEPGRTGNVECTHPCFSGSLAANAAADDDHSMEE